MLNYLIIVTSISTPTLTLPEWIKAPADENVDLIDVFHLLKEEKAILIRPKPAALSLIKRVAAMSSVELVHLSLDEGPYDGVFASEATGIPVFGSVSSIEEMFEIMSEKQNSPSEEISEVETSDEQLEDNLFPQGGR